MSIAAEEGSLPMFYAQQEGNPQDVLK